MNEDLDGLFAQREQPDAALLQRINAQFAVPSTPVRPLPSNLFLCSISLAIFVVVSFIVAAAFGLKAIAALSAGEITLYYGAVFVLAVLFSRALVERMIPGEKRFVPSSTLLIGAVAILGILLARLFSDYSTQRFVALGFPCLRLGFMSALMSGAIGWRLLQRGYLVTPRETLVLYGFFAGLVGVAVLALHCPIRNSLHVLVWHLGAMLLSGLTGLFIARFVERRNDAN